MVLSLLSSLVSKVLSGQCKASPDRPWVLIVTHNASRTGAPIVAQNLAVAFSRYYNVVVLSLTAGPLLPAFRDACVEVLVPRRFIPKPLRVALSIAILARTRPLHFALINSASSASAAFPLSRAGVPIIALIHEFVAYLSKRDRLRRLFEQSNALVFSSKLTSDDANRTIGLPSLTKVCILPQGKCVIPGEKSTSDEPSSKALRSKLKPEGAENAFLVIGAGTVEYRKGVDLFVSLAAVARNSAPDIPWRFVWIGGELATGPDGDYRRFVADQIDRCDVGDIVSVIQSTPEIEIAYAEADALALTSRLDPLPNVAIDALAAGLPVLSFEKATGLAEILQYADLNSACIASYLDLHEMAERLVALARSPELRKSIGARSAELSRTKLQMSTYASSLVELAESIVAFPKP